SGQACISVQRVVVEEPVREEFLSLLAERVRDVAVGDPRLPETRVAPLIDERSTDRVLAWVAAAVAAGARLVAGGVREGRSVAPTVLADVPDGADAWDEEIFGPVVCVRTVRDLEEAFAVVNASRYGLHASVYTASLATAFAAIERIEAGGVVVNEVPGFRADNMPYGGVKDSGTGREGPRFAIEELTVTRMAIIRP
ncbi:aldehyde dehydrogenase family protein, partial [Nonomuraea longicatena]|uniref:aldehyde dehydrogenase family protein n=1 Tax=Nonomuraea longicatena TaxID=83682 RepID=UPI0031E0998F